MELNNCSCGASTNVMCIVTVDSYEEPMYYILCYDCKLRTKNYPLAHLAEEAWNKGDVFYAEVYS